MPKFNFNYCKTLFKPLFFVYELKLKFFNYNIQNTLTIILIIMSEGAEVEIDILTFKLGDLKETSASTKRNGRRGRAYRIILKKVKVRVRLVAATIVTATSPLPSLSLSLLLHGGTAGGASLLAKVVVVQKNQIKHLQHQKCHPSITSSSS